MELTKLRAAILSLLALALVVAWAIVITIAISVSEMVLDSLTMIVELAAISP